MNALSFIVPAYNCAEFIQKAVASIYDSNFAEGDEVIIVNDASTDNTLELVNDLKQKFSGIRVVNHQFNKGSAAASRNTGIDHSSNELIFTLDADNLLVPGSIPKLKELLLKENADAAAFEGKFFFEDVPEKISNKWYYKRKEIDLGYALSTRYWPGPSGNYLFTRDSWIKAGRYNENIGGAIDSWAFGIKQLATGARMVILPDSYYYHKHGYDSTYVRNENSDNLNIRGLNIISEIYDLIDPIDLEYIFSKWGRVRWLSNLEMRPIRVKSNKKHSKLQVVYSKTKFYLKDIILTSA